MQFGIGITAGENVGQCHHHSSVVSPPVPHRWRLWELPPSPVESSGTAGDYSLVPG